MVGVMFELAFSYCVLLCVMYVFVCVASVSVFVLRVQCCLCCLKKIVCLCVVLFGCVCLLCVCLFMGGACVLKWLVLCLSWRFRIACCCV